MFSSIIGGILIGTGASLLLLVKGKIAGISGILNNLITLGGEKVRWRYFFISGIIISSVLYRLIMSPERVMELSSPLLLSISGLLVGMGVTLGNGCTAGHGVCGLGRLSLRSLAAIIMIMMAGMFAATYIRGLII